jgi:oligo-1,6-glucosidase/glucan 1,6-alpha-glucosidase
MNSIYSKGRDNARTPMQWDDSNNSGFTTSKEPWIKVNSNYRTVNVKKALDDKESIFYHYKKLIQVRKEHETIIYGDYKLILEDNNQVFAYLRQLNEEKILVICNFYNTEVEIDLSKENLGCTKEIMLSNYNDTKLDINKILLRPYEAIMYKL